MTRRTLVFGPAYLDRILRADRPLIDPGQGGPLDQSIDGRWKFGPGMLLVDPAGGTISVELPGDWPGPTGEVTMSRSISREPSPWRRSVRALSWHDDLGGMGAGFAVALGAELIGAL